MLTKTYGQFTKEYFDDIVNNGVTIYSSGTSGPPKAIWQSPEKIKANNKAAIKSQNITPDSKIYTCLNLKKAGGLFAQTIPALSIGASVDLEQFDPYRYVKVADKYTHTHLTPLQAKAVMSTKTFQTLDLTGKIFLCGSEPVTYDIIEAFIERGATVILIWGMTEIGVNAIMHTLYNKDDVNKIKKITPPNSTLLGNEFNCDWIIYNNKLVVRGEISVYHDWYDTLDEVTWVDGILFYTGRNGTPVDFNKPRKG